MSSFDDNNSDEPGFIRSHPIAVGVGAILLIAVIVIAVKLGSKGSSGGKQQAPMRMVSLAMPTPYPTPPPPPPPPTPPPEEKMLEQTPVDDKEEKPEPKPQEAPSLGTNIKGDGPPDGFGVGGNSGSIGGNGSGKHGSGSKFGWYAGQVQSRVSEALRNNRKTRTATMSIQVRIWPDSTGRVTRATVVGTTGDKALDSAIQNEVLTGLQLQEPPPQGMPTPIVMRLTARRP